ncbi:hypothetical protein OC25_20390 [Pedobacter kyungheensis]|uniref:Uncharacterized protein n=2 Tax=Pedobacter TaxID=84567 RepID=A0A0C1D468_9SPHI|nr:hypothetical protein OC25_20390 [Pedobacter kyungheensis]
MNESHICNVVRQISDIIAFLINPRYKTTLLFTFNLRNYLLININLIIFDYKYSIMATILESEMLNYFTQLDDAEKTSVVKMLKAFIKGKKENPKQSLEQYNSELLSAENEFKNGNYISHDELLNEIKSW